MKTTIPIAVAMAALLTMAPESFAGSYRLYFKGSEVLAMQSGAVRPAGYLGTPAAPAAPGDLNSGACSTCVPGGSASPWGGAGTPNQIVTFFHPYTCKAITVPLTLPVGKPTIVTRSDRIIYNYGFLRYKVVVKFLPNGQVEVKYDD